MLHSKKQEKRGEKQTWEQICHKRFVLCRKTGCSMRCRHDAGVSGGRRFRDHAGYSEQTERRNTDFRSGRSCKSRDPGAEAPKNPGGYRETIAENEILKVLC